MRNNSNYLMKKFVILKMGTMSCWTLKPVKFWTHHYSQLLSRSYTGILKQATSEIYATVLEIMEVMVVLMLLVVLKEVLVLVGEILEWNLKFENMHGPGLLGPWGVWLKVIGQHYIWLKGDFIAPFLLKYDLFILNKTTWHKKTQKNC